jgi:hypothetical protein
VALGHVMLLRLLTPDTALRVPTLPLVIETISPCPRNRLVEEPPTAKQRVVSRQPTPNSVRPDTATGARGTPFTIVTTANFVELAARGPIATQMSAVRHEIAVRSTTPEIARGLPGFPAFTGTIAATFAVPAERCPVSQHCVRDGHAIALSVTLLKFGDSRAAGRALAEAADGCAAENPAMASAATPTRNVTAQVRYSFRRTDPSVVNGVAAASGLILILLELFESSETD